MNLSSLIQRWRCEHAPMLRAHGALEAATTKEADAAELEAFVERYANEALTLADAAKESGFSLDHLSRLIAEQKIENVGVPKAPRLRRADLPRKLRPRSRAAPQSIGNERPDLLARAGHPVAER